MKKDHYVFPVVLTYAEDGISSEFSDLPGCLPCAHTTGEALQALKRPWLSTCGVWSGMKIISEVPRGNRKIGRP